MNRIVSHIRGSAVAYVALFVALGGTSYAALNLPANSVGTKQLRRGAVTNGKLANKSITPIKFDPSRIGGSIRHWVSVSENGRVLGGSRGARVSGGGPIYLVSWGDRFSSRCAAMVTPAGSPGAAPIADSTGVVINEPGTRHEATVVYVWTYSGGSATPAPFYLDVIC